MWHKANDHVSRFYPGLEVNSSIIPRIPVREHNRTPMLIKVYIVPLTRLYVATADSVLCTVRRRQVKSSEDTTQRQDQLGLVPSRTIRREPLDVTTEYHVGLCSLSTVSSVFSSRCTHKHM